MAMQEETQKQVLEILGKTVKRQKESFEIDEQIINSLQNLANEVHQNTLESREAKKISLEAKDQAIEAKNEAIKAKNEMLVAKKDFENNARLFPSDENDLFNKVREKATELTKQLYGKGDNELAKRLGLNLDIGFTKIVGKFRMKIWHKHNKKFSIRGYKNLPKKNVEYAKEYISSISINDFL